MAKDVIVHIWCDWHMAKDERVEGVEQSPITLEGRTLTLDLCDPCVKEFIEPLTSLLDMYGAVPTISTPVVQRRSGAKHGHERGAQCVWCPLDFSANSGSGYMHHIKVVHGFAKAVEAFGTVCPICGQNNLRMMMSHIKRKHAEYGFTHTSQAVHWAKEHGDPWGVYAAALASKPSLTPR